MRIAAATAKHRFGRSAGPRTAEEADQGDVSIFLRSSDSATVQRCPCLEYWGQFIHGASDVRSFNAAVIHACSRRRKGGFQNEIFPPTAHLLHGYLHSTAAATAAARAGSRCETHDVTITELIPATTFSELHNMSSRSLVDPAPEFGRIRDDFLTSPLSLFWWSSQGC